MQRTRGKFGGPIASFHYTNTPCERTTVRVNETHAAVMCSQLRTTEHYKNKQCQTRASNWQRSHDKTNTSCSQLHDANGSTDYTISIFDSSYNGTSTVFHQ
jgi:alpha-D-ribose 1-methylphosphonate 5-triphosphate synthase subunit PhnG